MSNKASATLAVLVVAAGGGNAAISNQTGQDVREMRTVVQELSRDVSLLKWRVTSLEGEGNGEG